MNASLKCSTFLSFNSDKTAVSGNSIYDCVMLTGCYEVDLESLTVTSTRILFLNSNSGYTVHLCRTTTTVNFSWHKFIVGTLLQWGSAVNWLTLWVDIHIFIIWLLCDLLFLTSTIEITYYWILDNFLYKVYAALCLNVYRVCCKMFTCQIW